MLFADVIAAEPAEVIPVVHLVLHLGHARFARAIPDSATIPIGPQERQVTERAVVNAFDCLHVAGLVAALEADAHSQPLFVRQFVGLDEHVIAGCIDAAGLFHEHMLAGFDGGRVLRGFKAGRRGDDHHVGAAVDGIDVRLQADKDAIGGQIHAGFEITVAQPLGRAFRIRLEGVGHGDDPCRFVSLHAVLDRAIAAASAADQHDLQFVAAGGMGHAGHADLAGQCRAGTRHHRSLQKAAPGSCCLFTHDCYAPEPGPPSIARPATHQAVTARYSCHPPSEAATGGLSESHSRASSMDSVWPE